MKLLIAVRSKNENADCRMYRNTSNNSIVLLDKDLNSHCITNKSLVCLSKVSDKAISCSKKLQGKNCISKVCPKCKSTFKMYADLENNDTFDESEVVPCPECGEDVETTGAEMKELIKQAVEKELSEQDVLTEQATEIGEKVGEEVINTLVDGTSNEENSEDEPESKEDTEVKTDDNLDNNELTDNTLTDIQEENTQTDDIDIDNVLSEETQDDFPAQEQNSEQSSVKKNLYAYRIKSEENLNKEKMVIEGKLESLRKLEKNCEEGKMLKTIQDDIKQLEEKLSKVNETEAKYKEKSKKIKSCKLTLLKAFNKRKNVKIIKSELDQLLEGAETNESNDDIMNILNNQEVAENEESNTENTDNNTNNNQDENEIAVETFISTDDKNKCIVTLNDIPTLSIDLNNATDGVQDMIVNHDVEINELVDQVLSDTTGDKPTLEEIGAEEIEAEISDERLNEIRSDDEIKEIKNELTSKFRKVISLVFEENRKQIDGGFLELEQEIANKLADLGCEDAEIVSQEIIDDTFIKDMDRILDKSEQSMQEPQEELDKRSEIVASVKDISKQRQENSYFYKKAMEAKNRINNNVNKIIASNIGKSNCKGRSMLDDLLDSYEEE